MTRILVVDDDRGILNVIRKALEKEGYQTDTLDDPEKLDFRRLNDYQLILLDVMMPGTDGFSLCRRIRDQVDCPILFVTAKTDEADLMTGLGIGGDDYITKPFSMDELLARISAHLRREERKGTASNLRFDEELIINYNSRTVFYGETPLEFSNKEFEIIRLLSQNAGMVFDRETIYEKLWGYDGEGDSIVVKEHIRKIRNKLSAYTDKNYIETVWGVGYKWAK